MSPPRTFLTTAALAGAVMAAAAAPPPARALASAWAENPESQVRLVTPYRVAPRQGELWLGLHFRLAPEWHVYWKNSGDAGFPPAIELEGTPELSGAELLWPAPERYELPGGLVAFGYEEEVVYPVRATVDAAGGDRVEIALRVDYLVCRIDCVPYGYTLRVDQPVGPAEEADPSTASLLAAWKARLPLPAAEVPGVATDGRLDVSDLRRPVLTVTVDGARAVPDTRPELFLEAHELFDAEHPRLEEAPSGLRFRVPLEPRERLDAPPAQAAFAWTVTGLAAPAGLEGREAGAPFALEARRSVPAGAGEGAGDREEAARGNAAGPGAGVAGLLLAALAGGLFLAATPAALALVLVLLGSLRRLAAVRPGEVVPRAATAAAGTLAAGLALGAADLATAGSGWSRLLQAPPAVAGLALVALLFTLGLWGLLGQPGGGAAPGAAAAGRASAFAAGVLLPVLALPWNLPPAAGALDRAAALAPPAGPVAVVGAAVAAAAGLALPLGVGALVLRRRPVPPAEGRSSGRRLEALGFLAALSVVWLLYVLSGLLTSEDLAFVELALLGVGLATWAGRRTERATVRRAWQGLAALAAVALLWIAAMG